MSQTRSAHLAKLHVLTCSSLCPTRCGRRRCARHAVTADRGLVTLASLNCNDRQGGHENDVQGRRLASDGGEQHRVQRYGSMQRMDLLDGCEVVGLCETKWRKRVCSCEEVSCNESCENVLQVCYGVSRCSLRRRRRLLNRRRRGRRHGGGVCSRRRLRRWHGRQAVALHEELIESIARPSRFWCCGCSDGRKLTVMRHRACHRGRAAALLIVVFRNARYRLRKCHIEAREAFSRFGLDGAESVCCYDCTRTRWSSRVAVRPADGSRVARVISRDRCRSRTRCRCRRIRTTEGQRTFQGARSRASLDG